MDEDADMEIRKNLYMWLDSIPFSRPRKRLGRYFADASAVAELVHYFSPGFVLTNAYPPCNRKAGKIDNWERLERKVLRKLGISLTSDQIRNLADAKLEFTESFLCQLAKAIYRNNYNAIQRALIENEPSAGFYVEDSCADGETDNKEGSR